MDPRRGILFVETPPSHAAWLDLRPDNGVFYQAVNGKLLLLPNLLSKEAHPDLFFPPSVQRAALRVNGLIAETEKAGRAFLKHMGADYRNTPIRLLNKHHRALEELLEPIQKGECWGLISDAGLPVLADPGDRLVALARTCQVAVEAFVGPSSLVMALMLSGLPSQRFAFHGYLPRRPQGQIRSLQHRSRKEGSTQMFIEAPFRNRGLFRALLDTLNASTALCVAWDLTMPSQGVETASIGVWRERQEPKLHKRPAVFLFCARVACKGASSALRSQGSCDPAFRITGD